MPRIDDLYPPSQTSFAGDKKWSEVTCVHDGDIRNLDFKLSSRGNFLYILDPAGRIDCSFVYQACGVYYRYGIEENSITPAQPAQWIWIPDFSADGMRMQDLWQDLWMYTDLITSIIAEHVPLKNEENA